jgi:hypothetical protein
MAKSHIAAMPSSSKFAAYQQCNNRYPGMRNAVILMHKAPANAIAHAHT